MFCTRFFVTFRHKDKKLLTLGIKNKPVYFVLHSFFVTLALCRIYFVSEMKIKASFNFVFLSTFRNFAGKKEKINNIKI